jgi:hypothetical protein
MDALGAAVDELRAQLAAIAAAVAARRERGGGRISVAFLRSYSLAAT